MNVWDFSAPDLTLAPLARQTIKECLLLVLREQSLPQNAITDHHGAVRAIVVVYGRALAGPPAEYKHLYELVAKDSVARVGAGLETAVRLNILARYFSSL